MEIYQGVVLGILQGLTEFLPVSSSGHLALGRFFFGITEPGIFFEISVHMGTLLAVIVVFFDDIKSMLLSLLKHIKTFTSLKQLRDGASKDKDLRMIMLILLGSIPTAFIGLFLKSYVDVMFRSVGFVGCMLLITGTFLWMTRNFSKTGVDIIKTTPQKALIIGLCQGMAVMPGISRSGSTIAAGLFLGIDRETSARFSFLLSIPAIMGAELVSMKDFFAQNISLDMATVYGTLVSFIVGYAALIVLMKVVKKGRFHLFAPYCWILGIIAVGVSFF